MKCPHCGNFVPTPLNQPLVRIPDTLQPRWPNAEAFMSLVGALDGNVRDATLLCLMVEDQLQGKHSTSRELAARSMGLFSRIAMTRLKSRVEDQVAPPVLTFSEAHDSEEESMTVNLDLVRRLATERAEEADPFFLWFYELTGGNFRNTLVLSILRQAGADQEAKSFTGQELLAMCDGLYTDSREIYRALSQLAPWRGSGLVQRPDPRYLALDSAQINSRLAQQAAAWVDQGCPPDPWEAGMAMLLAHGQQAESMDLAQTTHTHIPH